MNFKETSIKGVFLIEPKVFVDKRGFFMESFNKKEFDSKIRDVNFIQENESKSSHGVLRGLHFQLPPYDQAKLVRVIKGEVLDVIVDIRKNSNSFGKHETFILSHENKKSFCIYSSKIGIYKIAWKNSKKNRWHRSDCVYDK